MVKQYVQTLGEGILRSGQGEFRQQLENDVNVVKDGNCQRVGCYIDADVAIAIPEQYRGWIPKLAGNTVVLKNPFSAEAVYFAQNGGGILPVLVSFVGTKGVQTKERVEDYVARVERTAIKRNPDKKRVSDVTGFMKEMARILGYASR